MIRIYTSFALLCSIILLATSCDKDDPFIPDEPEVITTLIYQLQAENQSLVELAFTDLDGDGGADPTVVGGTLLANTIYTGTVILLNESEDPAEDISVEVAEEDEEHQLFFQSDITGLSVDYLDTDSNGLPLGLSTRLTTGATGSGSLTVVLRHEPVKDAEGVSDGSITNAGGETDIEVTFPIDVQ